MSQKTQQPEAVREESRRRRAKLSEAYPGREVRIIAYEKDGRWCFSHWVRVHMPRDVPAGASADDLLAQALAELRRVAAASGAMHSSWDVLSALEAKAQLLQAVKPKTGGAT